MGGGGGDDGDGKGGGGGGGSNNGRGYGIEIQSWSDLPTGSGLGTSSILAACIIAASARVCGKSMTEDSLVHAVLLTEQLLTTGKNGKKNKKNFMKSFFNRPHPLLTQLFLVFFSFQVVVGKTMWVVCIQVLKYVNHYQVYH